MATPNRIYIGKKCATGKVLLCRKRPPSWTKPCGAGRIRHPETHRCRKADKYPQGQRNRLRYQQMRWLPPVSPPRSVSSGRRPKRAHAVISSSTNSTSTSRKRRRIESSSSPDSPFAHDSPRSATPAFSQHNGSPPPLHFSPSPMQSASNQRSSNTASRAQSSSRERSSSKRGGTESSRSVNSVPRKRLRSTSPPRPAVKKKARSKWPDRKGPKNSKRVQNRINYKV